MKAGRHFFHLSALGFGAVFGWSATSHRPNFVAAGGTALELPRATSTIQRPVAQVDATNPKPYRNASHPAARLRGYGRGENGSECASLRSRVAPSRVFSELQSSAKRLVALDPIARHMRRILVAKSSPTRPGQLSAIPIEVGRGATPSSLNTTRLTGREPPGQLGVRA